MSKSICMIKEDGKIGFVLKMAASQTDDRFLSAPPSLPFLPSLLASRPTLPRTSVGMYPPLNRSRWATAGSLTAQYGSSINQRHFQCPITETLLLGLSEADSSPIHLLGGEKKPLWHASRLYLFKRRAVKSAGRPPLKLFSLGQANNKKGKLLVSGNTQGEVWQWQWV